MTRETPLIIGTTIFMLVFGILSSFLMRNYAPDGNAAFSGSWACTADIRVCPDGSTVSRIPPYCQFSVCQ